jgi:hypothetical protein
VSIADETGKLLLMKRRLITTPSGRGLGEGIRITNSPCFISPHPVLLPEGKETLLVQTGRIVYKR